MQFFSIEFEIGPQDDRRGDFVNVGAAAPRVVPLGEERTLGFLARPALVQGVHRQARSAAQGCGEFLGAGRFRAMAPIHVSGKAYDDGSDVAFSNEFADRRNVGFSANALQRAGGKGDVGLGIRDREADPFVTEIQTEHTHQDGNCSGWWIRIGESLLIRAAQGFGWNRGIKF